MKKVILSIVAASAVFAITSCGGNTEDAATLTQAQADSIQAATELKVKDSIAAEELRIADSTRVADSLIEAGKSQAVQTQKTTTTTTKNNNNSGKTTTTTKVEEVKTAVDAADKKVNERFEQKNNGNTTSQEVENKLNDRFKNRN